MTKAEFLSVLTQLTNKLANKIDTLFVRKETGKGLSTNDFTTEYKNKLDTIAEGAGNITVDETLSDTSTNAIQNKTVKAALDSKADSTHNHAFSDLTEVPTTLAGYGITDAESSGAANTALESAKGYTDQKIADLINGAPTTLDTLKEIADAMEANQTVVEALDTAVGTKANTSDLTSHTEDTTVHITSTERTNLEDAISKKHSHSNSSVLDATTASFTTELKTKLDSLDVMEDVTNDDIDAIIAGTFTE